jgi:DNA gyrase/topoisomerase IV subunit B
MACGCPLQGRRLPRQDRHRSHLHAVAETFTNTDFDFGTLEHRLRELAFLNSGVKHHCWPTGAASTIRSVTLHYEGGLEAFVRYLDRSKKPAARMIRSS